MWFHRTRGDATVDRKPIVLTTGQRNELKDFTETGVHSARLIKRARVILMLDESEDRRPATFAEIVEKESISSTAVTNIKNAFLASSNLSDFLQRKKRETPPVEPKVNGEVEAHIIALACSTPPEGYARWSLRLLADKSVELNLVDSISHNTIKILLT